MRANRSGRGRICIRGRKGFGYGVRTGRSRAGPGNTSMKELLADTRFTEAFLNFLKATSVGKVKEDD